MSFYTFRLSYHAWILYLLISQGESTEEPRGILQMLGISYASCRLPSDFPSTIHLKREVIKDPDRKLPDKLLWKAFPKSSSQIVLLTNWAMNSDFNLLSVELLSAMSSMSSRFWGEKLTRDGNCTRTLLVDATKHLTKMQMVNANLVTVETGVMMLDLLAFLEKNGHGLPIAPIPGQKVLTVGEAIAIGAYGIGVNNHKEKASNPFGTVSNLVMSFKTVAWDRTLEVYSLKKFDRPDPRSLAFLTNLGRSFLTQVTLLVQPRYHLRCQTFSEFPSENLYANPNSSFYMIEESFAYLVEQFGKVEVTYFPYVDRSWVKVWSKETKRPMGSLKVNTKYLSGASSPIINMASAVVSKLVYMFPSFSPLFSRFMFDIEVVRMRLSGANDIWGTSHDTFFTFTNDTESYKSKGYVVLTTRADIQQVVYDFYEQFSLLRDQFKQKRKYPTTRPLKIRISSLDSPSSVKENGSPLVPPALSVLSPVKNHPEFEVGVVFEMEFLPGDESGVEFVEELEPWMYATFQGDYGLLRPLWSIRTEWAHESGSFKGHEGTFKQLIKHSYGPAWNTAIRVLDFYDPHGVFNSPFFESFSKA